MIQQIKKKNGRSLTGLLSITLLLTKPLSVYAESVSFTGNGQTYYFQSDLLKDGWSIHEGIFTVEGTPAYCIEPTETVIIGEDRYETGSFDAWNGYSKEIRDRITEYSWFGYGHGSFTSMEYWYATQILIWQSINPAFADTHVWRDPSYDGSGIMSSSSVDITSEIRACMTKIQNEVDEYHRQPQPVYKDDRGNTLLLPLQVSAGEVVHVLDSAGVLNHYRLKDPVSGVEQKGNELILDTKKLSSGTLVFLYEGMDETLTSAPLLLKAKDGSRIQTLIIRGRCESKEFHIDLKIEEADLKLIKKDASGTAAAGEAELCNAKYELRNETENRLISVLQTKEDGVSETVHGLNVSDTYSLRETEAPKGYILDEEVYRFTLKELPLENGVYAVERTDRIITGVLAIHKMIANRFNSDLCVNEEGAQFTVLSERSIREYGSFEKALEHYEEIHELEKARIVTDKEGYAQSGPLAYGSYLIRQTKASSPDLDLVEDFRFTVKENSAVPILFEVSNLPTEYQLKVIKKDAATGKTVSYHPAAFMIRLEDGSFLKQKVGSAVYDTFMTSSKQRPSKVSKNTFIDTSSEEGTLVLPLPLSSGKYELIEVASPYGYAVNKEPLAFEVTHTKAADEETPYVEVIMKDERISGKLSVKKIITSAGCDTSLIDPADLSGIVFSLNAAEDILSPQDGSVICEKGEEYTKLITDESGNAEISDLPPGSYVLRETETKPGLIPDTKESAFMIDEDHLSAAFEIENIPTLTRFSKKQAAGSEELEGAHLCIRDHTGNIVDEWISTSTPHIIEGLDPGQTYTLSETLTPRDGDGNDAGYVKASSVSFTPSSEAQGSTVTMIDTVTEVIKTDENGNTLSGAHLSVIDEEGNTVDEWISGNEPHRVKGLEAGNSYTLIETGSPQGYYRSYDISFTAGGETDQTLIMKDAPIRVLVRKIDENTGEDLSGVTLSLYEVNEEEEETLILSWQTDGEAKPIGEYLKAGTLYRLEESEITEGVYQAADLYFVTDVYDSEDEEPLQILMFDAAVRLSAIKTDTEGRYVKGAHLCIEDEEGNLIHEWISEEAPHDLSAYVRGDAKYTLKELEAPEGYAVCDPVTFRVSGNSERSQMVRAVDRTVRIHLSVLKTDSETGSALSDCEVTVFTKADGRIAKGMNGKDAKLITDENGKASLILPYDPQGYEVRETKAPKGYTLNPNSFDVLADTSHNPPVIFKEVHITDQKKTVKTGIGSSEGEGMVTGGGSLLSIVLTLRCIKRYKERSSSR